MAENMDFVCRACGAHFASRDRLNEHNRREHAAHGESRRQDESFEVDEPGSSAQRRNGSSSEGDVS